MRMNNIAFTWRLRHLRQSSTNRVQRFISADRAEESLDTCWALLRMTIALFAARRTSDNATGQRYICHDSSPMIYPHGTVMPANREEVFNKANLRSRRASLRRRGIDTPYKVPRSVHEMRHIDYNIK